MKLSEYSTESLAPFITGDNSITIKRSGKELVTLFNDFGFRDVYNNENGGLPRLSGSKLNTSRTTYTKNRLKLLSERGEIRSILEFIINSSENKEDTAILINKIISPENYNAEKDGDNYIIVGGHTEKKQPVKNNAHFMEIQNNILLELDKASVSILVAMAWFTNNILFKKLIEKKEQGLNVELVIYNDGVNAKHGVAIEQLDSVKIRAKNGGIMHDKFCVIDNQVVITGSYNWSDNAEYRNEENITISKDNQLATKYSIQFRELKLQAKK